MSDERSSIVAASNVQQKQSSTLREPAAVRADIGNLYAAYSEMWTRYCRSAGVFRSNRSASDGCASDGSGASHDCLT